MSLEKMLSDIENALNQLQKNMSVIHSSNVIDRKLIRKIENLIERLLRNLRFFSAMFLNYRYGPNFLSQIRNKTCSLCNRLGQLIIKNIALLRRDLILRSVKEIVNCGCLKTAEKVFNMLIDNSENFSGLADTIDNAIECGFLDIALRGLVKLADKGLSFKEIMYNRALICYLMGRDKEALQILQDAVKKYGEQRQFLGLLSAVYIGLGLFDQAKKILERIR